MRYPYTSVNGRLVYEHRHVWASVNGPIPDGMVVCHSCDNSRCVNVEHLFLGTQRDNMRDASAKGRIRNGNERKTACPNGHPYSGVNSRGRRICQPCANARKRAANAALL